MASKMKKQVAKGPVPPKKVIEEEDSDEIELDGSDDEEIEGDSDNDDLKEADSDEEGLEIDEGSGEEESDEGESDENADSNDDEEKVDQSKDSSDDDDKDEEKSPSISNSIFVGHIDFKTKNTELAEIFEKCGEIKKANVVPRKGFGFVEFVSADAVDKALKLDKTKIKGREIHVERSKSGPKDKNADNAKVAATKGQKKALPGQFVKLGAQKRVAEDDDDSDSDEDDSPAKKSKQTPPKKKFNPNFQKNKGKFQGGQKGNFKPGGNKGKFQGKQNKAK